MESSENKLKNISDKLDILLKSQETFHKDLKSVFENFNELKVELDNEAKVIETPQIDTTPSIVPQIVTNIETNPKEIIESQLENIIEPKEYVADNLLNVNVAEEEKNIELENKIEEPKTNKPVNPIEEYLPKKHQINENAKTKFSEFTDSSTETPKPKPNPTPKPPKDNFNLDWEKYIGENLINKIGIAITIIGVAIGAKYSIDNNIINPLVRIILGYLIGAALLLVGIRTKEKYENYSAVLVSGAIAILYFITYFAYSFFGLFTIYVAFPLMLIFTSFTILAAINYNKLIIALIGIVGAYAVPFLLSSHTGNVNILFSYIALLNVGILIIAYQRYWKQLYYSSFVITWLIFSTWFGMEYQPNNHFGLVLTFNLIFFATFYIILMLFKVKHHDNMSKDEGFYTNFMLLFNSAMFYGIGYHTLSGHNIGNFYLGIFTLVNALIHFANVAFIYKRGLADKNFNYLVAGLVILFITIAVPVQLKGNWVTMMWALEAALLFWFGRTRKIIVSENLSYIVMVLATLLLLRGWKSQYNYAVDDFTPIFNKQFMGIVVYVIAFSFIAYINLKKEYISSLQNDIGLRNLFNISLSIVLATVVYFSLFNELAFYFDKSYYLTQVKSQIYGNSFNDNILKFKYIWLINYSLVFVAGLNLLNSFKVKNRNFGLFNLFSTLGILVIFLSFGLWNIGDLLYAYIYPYQANIFPPTISYLIVRYFAFAFVAFLLFTFKKILINESLTNLVRNSEVKFEFLMYIIIGWLASNEVIHWMTLSGSEQAFKLGLSIFWGVYSSILIVLGIWKSKKHLRVGAITLFGLTLIKLFLIDISNMQTIYKTVIFVILGVLLLIISFLYNKYKHVISGEDVINK